MLEFVDMSNKVFLSICKGRKINKAIFIIHLFSVLFSSIYLQHYYAIIILALSHAYIFCVINIHFYFNPFTIFLFTFIKFLKLKSRNHKKQMSVLCNLVFLCVYVCKFVEYCKKILIKCLSTSLRFRSDECFTKKVSSP